ncbi:hypothetical protein UFOVP4_28 [uncultured Caudovirales phage]|uniref:Uncharacterized protein n=1 Tax=uncultured Caudovirales phage TaxID=2100421 RepID=A0A6J7VK23_9CAUD|nr:hypothetical protein UFOVP4_28 [uncultured Caudovirales phage]CAB4241288.1 hypothetical protein UFOVP64_32 [uncultured Caudovirales phage]CAB5079005.1 hypothetical protein UFOVP145_46 [uncultured Caudovirales phage]
MTIAISANLALWLAYAAAGIAANVWLILWTNAHLRSTGSRA